MISRQDAIETVRKAKNLYQAHRMLIQLLSVDAVPVVRCRECRWCNMGECEHKFGLLVSNDENYCSYGERDVDI